MATGRENFVEAPSWLKSWCAARHSRLVVTLILGVIGLCLSTLALGVSQRYALADEVAANREAVATLRAELVKRNEMLVVIDERQKTVITTLNEIKAELKAQNKVPRSGP